MNKEIIKSLKAALGYLKEGNEERARPLLVRILKQDPENDQAWYLLSFSVPQEERQIFALEQAIEFNPKNRAALTRLAELREEPVPEFEELVDENDDENESDEKNVREVEYVDTAEENDLLSQRLLESSESQEETSVVGENNELESTDSLELDSDSFVLGFSETLEDRANFEGEFSEKRKRKPPNVPSKARNLLLAGIVTAIVITFASFLLPKDQAASPTDQSSDSAIEMATDQVAPTLALAKTSTPTSTAVILPTQVFVPTITPMPASLSPSVLKAIPQMQSEIENIRGLISLSSPVIGMESGEYMENLIRRTVGGSEFDEDVKDNKSLYISLGLMNTSTSYIDYQRSQWGDPGIGIYLPENDLIAFTGLKFGSLQKYLFAFEFTHLLLEDNYQISEQNIFPTCIGDIQACQVKSALLKGDAMLTASSWIDVYGTDEDKNHIENMFKQYFLVPVQGVVPFVIEDLKFPYVKGGEFINSQFEIGGWASVDLAHLIPPSTTEQILHPEKFDDLEPAIEIKDDPIISLLGNSWYETYNGSVGEWTTFLMLAYPREVNSNVDRGFAEIASSGWGGDQVQVFRNAESGNTIMSGHWSWDTVDDATEFIVSLSEVLQTRYSSLGLNNIVDEYTCWETLGELSCLMQSGIQTVWVTAPSIDLISKIVQLYLFEVE